MTIISSDLKFHGKHGQIIKKLVERKLYSSHSEVFIESSLIGLYYGKKSEHDSFEKDNDFANVSRTVFSNNPEIEKIMFTFLQMEKKFQQNPVDSKGIFLYEDNNDSNDLQEELVSYALFGIEFLDKKHSSTVDNNRLKDTFDNLYNTDFQTEKELKNKVDEDQEVFYKSFDEMIVQEEMDEIDKIIENNAENE